MTRTGWAERKIARVYAMWLKSRGAWMDLSAKALEAEHSRAVRVVKKLARAAKQDPSIWTEAERDAYLDAVADILAALTRGREK